MDSENQHFLKVDLLYTRVVNFSLHQNHIPIIRKLGITNLTEQPYDELTVQFTFEPGFATADPIILHELLNGETYLSDFVELKLSASFLSELTERISGLVKVDITSRNHQLYENQYVIDILAFDQWQGLSMLPETLSSFITPNNPNIATVLKRSSVFLEQWTGNPFLDDYQSRNAGRVKLQMAAVFEAIRELRITYCTPPSNFEEQGQRIRMIDTVLSQRLGTCLDVSLLYASCLEGIGIHPLLVIIKGHAFAGGWLIDDSFADIVNDDPALLSKRMAEGINEILLVETTFMNDGATGSFDDSVIEARHHLARSEDFMMFIDVKRSRYTGIRPLPQRIKTENGWLFEEDDKTISLSGPPESIVAGGKPINGSGREITKQELWERKLLDLSLRNSLLNTRITGKTIQLLSVNLSKLEDALSEGSEFQFLAKPEGWDNPLRQGGVYQSLSLSDPVAELINRDMSQHRLRTYRSENDLAQGLTNLYRASRLSLEENGANTMYMCLGLLKWYEIPSSEQPRFAPIILLPVELIRKSALNGYVVRSREEDAQLNITLLEMLRQDYRINITGLDPLPRDGSGVDVKVIFNTFREAIMREKRWDIEEQAILGTFSFNKFIMWNDIHKNASRLAENKFVASLISGKAEWEVESNLLVSEDLDIKYNPGETALPLSADSSQIEAVCAASSNKSFILHGPPGTGKSQTITNIIANALYTGKKVLFVAEKMAALSVVQKRLEDIGLSPFCLELHSNKSKKSYFLEQLKRTSQLARPNSSEEFQAEADRIGVIRKELNDYVQALHTKHSSGLSLFDAFSGYASLAEFPLLIGFDRSVIDTLNNERITTWQEIAEELMAAGSMCGQPHGHALTGINVVQYDLRMKTEAHELLERYASILLKMKSAESEAADILCINQPVSGRTQANFLKNLCAVFISANDVPYAMLELENSEKLLDLTIKVSESGLRRNNYRDSLLASFGESILKLEAPRLRNEWDASLMKWFLPKSIDQAKIIKYLKRLSLKGKLEKSKAVSVLEEIIDYQHEQSQIDANSNLIAPILGRRWNKGEADWSAIENDCRAVLKLKESLGGYFDDPAAANSTRRALAYKLQAGFGSFMEANRKKLSNYLEYFNECQSIESEIGRLLLVNFQVLDAESAGFTQNRINFCTAWRYGLSELRDWVGWNQVKKKAIDHGLSHLVMHYEKGEVRGSDLVAFLMKSIYRACAENIILQDIRLSEFNGRLFEEKIRRFRELNRRFEELTRKEIYARLAAKVPDFHLAVAKSSEPGILLRNIGSGGRGTSIRKLIDTIPELLTRMCPCMLMSPISVAQYINIDNFKFDLVVFDEASQMPTSEAVGVIARGNSLIVVGDPKQLPPTNFFASNNIDEENLEKEDLESILDDCLALSLPSKHLLWHYRSRHESLISFSNSHYYGNSLMTFPSPDDLTSKVGFVHVPGFYDRGRSRQNRFEAMAVIGEISRRLSDPQLKEKSIGVVTFSSAQQILIDDMLTEAFRKSPDLEAAADELYEPIFIKNLENVQGDERDIILFSVGYGPDKDNKIYLNFGPLNREGGWRRLNVAVSRARQEMKVFSTIISDQIDITRSSSAGIEGLKAFLEFAEKGSDSLSFTKRKSNGQGSGIIERLATKLRENGYVVKTNIGCSGFKIDLGITNPGLSSKYQLGILCDGQNYKESKTAKDREIIQTEVLENLGWQIHRVWSCDWWDDESKVLQEIKTAFEKTEKKDDTNKLPLPEIRPDSLWEDKTGHLLQGQGLSHKTVKNSRSAESRREYEVFLPVIHVYKSDPELLRRYDFFDIVSADIRSVLAREAPISKELLSKRVMAAWSVTKIGKRIDAYLETVFAKMNLRFTQGRRKFFWDSGQIPDSYPYYRVPAKNLFRRDAEDIPPEEISNAVSEILQQQISMDYDDLVRETARVFGFERLVEGVRDSVIIGIDYASSRGYCRREGERITQVKSG